MEQTTEQMQEDRSRWLHATRDLSPAQSRYLSEIREAGERRYNGRARRPVEALAARGLIEFDYDQQARSKGNGIEIAEFFICRPSDNWKD